MDIPDIRILIQQGRQDTLDWLEPNASSNEMALALAAMANSAGGTLLVGIGSGAKPTIAGVKDRDSVVDQMIHAALSLDPPLVAPLPRAVTVDDQYIVVTQIPDGMPHVYACEGRYLYRRDGQNITLGPRDLRRLFIERGELSFETNVAPGATLDDIDWKKVQEYVDMLSNPADSNPRQVLLRRGCLTRQLNEVCPTHAGVLLFGKDPQRFVRGAEITAVRFAGESMSDTFTRQDIIGTLPDQIRRAGTFLADNLRKGVLLRHTMARREQYEYPMEAAREIVVNAVAHRDYAIEGDGIRMFIFKDRMEVHSPGKLPGPVTLDNIREQRFSRSPVIVQILSDMGFIERLGYGVDRVIELMQREGLDDPKFSETDGGFRVVLTNQNDPPETTTDASTTQIDNAILGKYGDAPLNPRQEAALQYLHEPETTRITNSELQRIFPDVHAETIRRDLAALVTKNILVKKGQKRGSYYELRQSNET